MNQLRSLFAPSALLSLFAAMVVVTALTLGVSFDASAQVAALDVSAATDYLETNAGGGMIIIGGVILVLAGLGVAIKWVKATFFG